MSKRTILFVLAVSSCGIANAWSEEPQKGERTQKFVPFGNDPLVLIDDVDALQAIRAGQLDEVKKLAPGMDPYTIRGLWRHIWVSPNPDVIEYLRREGLVDVSDLQMAAFRGDEKAIEAILRKTATKATKHNDTSFGHFGVVSYTPLRLAMRQGHTEAARVLILGGADVNERLALGSPALSSVLSEAIYFGHVEIAKKLIDAGADIDEVVANGFETTPDGSPLIFMAIGTGRKSMVKILLNANVDLDVRSADGATPLHAAVRKGHPGIVEILLKEGVDINSRDSNGLSPLRSAELLRHDDIAELLRNAGAK